MPRNEYDKGEGLEMDIFERLVQRSAAQYVINTLFDTDARITKRKAG